MKDNMDYKTLLNFSKGKYSYNDYLKVKDCFAGIEGNKESKKYLFEQWEELFDVEKENDYSLQHIFENVQYNILHEAKRNLRIRVFWNTYQKVAAILIIPVVVFSFWYIINSKLSEQTIPAGAMAQSWVEINAPDGARVKFFLPDSTSGWLNSRSKLKYPTVFKQNRKVELVGEAYFEVKHKSMSDFVVSVPDMDVRVLGTKFNVSAYSDDTFTDVVLKEGKVVIDGKAGIFNHTLVPNRKITFNRGSKILREEKVNADRYSAWKDGYLIIENETLGQVVGRLERWYNVKITIEDEALKNYRFKATFKDEPIEEVLRLMAKTTPIKFYIENREMDSLGVMKHKKIKLELKK